MAKNPRVVKSKPRLVKPSRGRRTGPLEVYFDPSIIRDPAKRAAVDRANRAATRPARP